MIARFPRVASFKTAAAFRQHLRASSIPLEFDEELMTGPDSPLGAPLDVDGRTIGNRFCILPMEGWDGTDDGAPSDLTFRRWRHFGASGAKLIWGGEAVAVSPDARANPHQLVIEEATLRPLEELRGALVREHTARFGGTGDPVVGLQLTHSGRYSRPRVQDMPEPLAACANPVLDARFPGGVHVVSDAELGAIVCRFVTAARRARDLGFAFVDIKHCHGYLAHELLGSHTRDGRYGGAFERRTTFLREVVDGVRAEAPGLDIGVRVSVFDTVPYARGDGGIGVPQASPDSYAHAFCLLGEENLDAALEESRALLALLTRLGLRLICTTAGSPYYSPHVQRPAAFPPVDGYEPPEDPLRGVARQIAATASLKRAFPDLVFVGSAYSYLQEWLPHVAQHSVRAGLTDFVGLGRIALSYPDLPTDVLEGRPLRRKALCRTFSDCTTGPRLGLVSGCYPLDPFYTVRAEADEVRRARQGGRQ
jgi:2,4-dienoyl-CoA reductase-like NADH-dependent reductase (Old Yellow Enzyme family)